MSIERKPTRVGILSIVLAILFLLTLGASVAAFVLV